uniref:G-protein coupled receptors family 1 profile domain-containing protein n=1 Tax=Anopheles epiroticus TaxID=199890 RepID=A0A182PGT6_9DIPT
MPPSFSLSTFTLELLAGNVSSAVENDTAVQAGAFPFEAQHSQAPGNDSFALGLTLSNAIQQQHQQSPQLNTTHFSNLSTGSNESLANLLLSPSVHQLSNELATLVAGMMGQAGDTILPREDCDRLNISYAFENSSAYEVPGLRCYEHAPTLSKSGVIRVIVLSAMAIVSLLGNVATMWNIQKNRKSRRVTRHNWSAIYSLIFHLSIADVLVTGFCLIGEAAWYYTVDWVAGNLFCKLFKLCQMFSLYLSTYVLVLVGVDRWVAVKYPMKSLNTARRCHRFLFVAYLLSFLLSTPQVTLALLCKHFLIFQLSRSGTKNRTS